MDNIHLQKNEEISTHYRDQSGVKSEISRIDKYYAFNEILKLVNFEKEFLYTCKGLLLQPGKIINEYIHFDRSKITNPITFLLLSSVIYTVITHFFKTDAIYSEFFKKTYGDTTLTNIYIWTQENLGYANLFMILPLTLWIKILFRKHKYNIYEVMVLLSLVMGFGTLLFSLESIFDYFFPQYFLLNNYVMTGISFLYLSWAIADFFGRSFKNFVKSFIAYILGFFTLQIAISIIAVVIDRGLLG